MIQLNERGIRDLAALCDAPDADLVVLRKQVKVLQLRGNALRSTGSGALRALAQLTELDVSSNKIASIAGGLPTTLTSIDLSGNRLTTLGDGLAGCTSLQHLNLSHNALTELSGLPRLARGPDAVGFSLVAAHNSIASCDALLSSVAPVMVSCDLRCNAIVDAKTASLLVAACRGAESTVLLEGNPCAAAAADDARQGQQQPPRASPSTPTTKPRVMSPPRQQPLRSPPRGDSTSADTSVSSSAQVPNEPIPPAGSDLVAFGGGALGVELGHLQLTAKTLHTVQAQLDAERSSNAHLRSQLRSQKRRADDAVAATKACNAEAARLREELHMVMEARESLQRRFDRTSHELRRMRRQLAAAESAEPSVGGAPAVAATTRQRRRSSSRTECDERADHQPATSSTQETLASAMLRQLSPIPAASPPDARPDGERGATAAGNQSGPTALDFDSSADPTGGGDEDCDELRHRIAELEAAVASRDAYIDALASENDDLAATAQRLIGERLSAVEPAATAAIRSHPSS